MVLKLFSSDLDGTLINYKVSRFGSSWDALFHAAGSFEESQKLLEEYLWKKHFYDEWFNNGVSLLKGVPVSVVEKILPPEYEDGAREMFSELKADNLYVGIISTGIDVVADYVAKDIGLDFCERNELVIENGFFTGFGRNIVSLWNKKSKLVDVCKRFGVEMDETAVIGDHENDIGLFEIAGTSIAYKPKSEKVENAADYVINDLNQVPVIIRNNC